MQRFFCCLILLYVIPGCGSSDNGKPDAKKIEEHSAATLPATLESFADSLVRLDKYAKENLDKAAYYYKKLVPADSALADSAAIMLLSFANGIVDTVNQKIWQDNSDLSNLVYTGGEAPTNEQKTFQQELKNQHINLQGNGEGDVVAVLDYDWFNAVVQPKTSAATDEYLTLLASEEKEPSVLDAAMAIELKTLVSRLMTAEFLAAKTLPEKFAADVQQKMKSYTYLLLLGVDNSPSLEYETPMKLVPEFKEVYDFVLATYPSSQAARKITEWLAIIKAKDHKKLEEMRAAQYQ